MPGPTPRPIIDDTSAEGSLPPTEPAERPEAAGLDSETRSVRPPLADTGSMPAVGVAEASDDSSQRDDGEEPESARPAEVSTAVQVLVVEDTPELAEMVVATLRRARIIAEYELRGEQALPRYIESKPPVILLDLNLPDLPGWKVLEAIRDYSRDNGVPGPRIIVMTAMGDPANRLVGKLQGVFGYIVKPCPTAELQAAVRNALESAE
ncbi:MAG: response regulator transcription factor [Anaerolineae bacterium]|nr:response regulator transcription factor [Anaerolineae bacterium]